jgi:hypothetical protein
MEFSSKEEEWKWINSSRAAPFDLEETYAKRSYVESQRNRKHDTSNGFKDDTRNYKGFHFENWCRVQFEGIPYISYNCNPSNYYDWLQHHNENHFDASVTYPNGETEKLEMKFTSVNVRIESSWFRRDWLPRDCNIYITPNPTAIKYKDKRKIEKMGRKIMSPSEYKVYSSKKAYNMIHPNQLSSWNSLITSIITIIKDRTSTIINKISILALKFRFSKCLFKLKSSFAPRLSVPSFKSKIFSALDHFKLSVAKSTRKQLERFYISKHRNQSKQLVNFAQ